MNLLHLATLLALAIAPRAGQDVDVAIVFAIDRSASVDKAERLAFMEGHASAIEAPQVVKAIQDGRTGCIAIAYFEWSSFGEQREVLPWSRICDQHDASQISAVIRSKATTTVSRSARRHATSISYALTWGAYLLDQFPWKAERKLIDLSAEGHNNDGVPVLAAREHVLRKGYVINAIALLGTRPDPENASLSHYLGARVIGGAGSFVLVAREPSSFARVLRRKLLVEISGAATELAAITPNRLGPAGAGRASDGECRTSGHPCR